MRKASFSLKELALSKHELTFQKHALVVVAVASAICLGLFHSSNSVPTLSLKSLSYGSEWCRSLCRFQCKAHLDTLRTVAKLLSGTGSLRVPIVKLCSLLAMEVFIMKLTPERRRSCFPFPDQKRV